MKIVRLSKVVVCRLDGGIVTQSAVRCAPKAMMEVVRKLVIDIKKLAVVRLDRREVDPVCTSMVVMVMQTGTIG